MAGYRTMIATGSGAPQAPAPVQQPQHPWDKLNFAGTVKPELFGRGNRKGPLKEGDGATAQDGHFGTYMNGDHGMGVYVGYSPAQQQAMAAHEFRENIPGLSNQMGNQLAGQVGGQVDQGIKQTQQADSRRGLLYGGMHAGNEQKVRGAGAAQVAQGRSDINKGLLEQADKIDSSAINTGLQIQQQQQAMQDAIYAQAMKSSSNTSAMAGQVVGTVAGIVAGAYSGGAGAYAGYQAGNQVGKSL